MTQRNRTPLTTLRDAAPATGVSRLRLMWPDMHAALELGHTIRAIHESLEQAGVSISYRHLCSCIARFRLECDIPDALRRRRSVATPAARKNRDDREADTGDPPGNVRNVSVGEGPDFNDDSGLPDKTKLIGQSSPVEQS